MVDRYGTWSSWPKSYCHRECGLLWRPLPIAQTLSVRHFWISEEHFWNMNSLPGTSTMITVSTYRISMIMVKPSETNQYWNDGILDANMHSSELVGYLVSTCSDYESKNGQTLLCMSAIATYHNLSIQCFADVFDWSTATSDTSSYTVCHIHMLANDESKGGLPLIDQPSLCLSFFTNQFLNTRCLGQEARRSRAKVIGDKNPAFFTDT